MKIEKLNDNQIRCTLTRADLDDRQLKLSELAYGSEKAKSLFHDMMQQAAFEFGFEANDMPLMIEAIPASSDSIVLIITKVEDPEELDTRFSRFAPSLSDTADKKKPPVLDKLEGAEQLLDILDKVKNAVAKAPESESKPEPAKPSVRLFSFSNLSSVIEAAHLLAPMYDGSNTLYKDAKCCLYLLAVHQSGLSATDFNRICNMLTEYGSMEKTVPASLAYLEEHCELIVSESAIQRLAAI